MPNLYAFTSVKCALSARGNFGESVFMRNQENQFETRDLGLLVFIVVAGWLLLFYSNLFQ